MDDIINKVNIFGYHFASLDIRQDSRIHSKAFESVFKVAQDLLITNSKENYSTLSEDQKIKILSKLSGDIPVNSFTDDSVVSILSSIRAMKLIQKSNGEMGSNRYIISNNQSALNILEVFSMFKLSDWKSPTVDIIPLFETVSDL